MVLPPFETMALFSASFSLGARSGWYEVNPRGSTARGEARGLSAPRMRCSPPSGSMRPRTAGARTACVPRAWGTPGGMSALPVSACRADDAKRGLVGRPRGAASPAAGGCAPPAHPPAAAEMSLLSTEMSLLSDSSDSMPRNELAPAGPPSNVGATAAASEAVRAAAPPAAASGG